MTGRGQAVSVLIPTRDRWGLLARMGLSAALAQEGVDLEVVIVDDGSVEPPPAGLAGLDDSRVRIVRHERPRGVPVARNTGIAEARSEWIALLDDDDAWSPDKLRRQLDAARESGAGFVYSGVVSVDDQGRVVHGYPVPAADELALELLARCAIPAGSSNVLVRTELVRSLGGFDESLPHLCDWDCWLRLAWNAPGSPTAEVLVAYLEHGDNLSLGVARAAFDEVERFERKHRALHVEHGVALDRVGLMHDAAWLQLRRRRRASAAAIYLRSAVWNRRPRDLVPAARFGLRAVVPLRRTIRRPAQSAPTPPPAWLERYRFA